MKVAILVGGRGTRLKPITDSIPKALVPINGVPFLKTLLISLKNGKEIFLLTGYKSRMISQFCKDNKFFGKVKIIHEARPLGTGGALRYLSKGRTPLLVMNGDTFVDIPFEKLLAFHLKKKAEVTILSFIGKRSARGAIAYDKTGKVTSFGEKTSKSKGAFSTGVYIINPKTIRRLVEFLPTKFSMERDGFPGLVKMGYVYTYVSSGQFYDIGTHESLACLNSNSPLKHMQCR